MNNKINNLLIRFLRNKKFSFIFLLIAGLYILNQAGLLQEPQVFFEKKLEATIKVLRVIDGDTLEAEYATKLPDSKQQEKLKIRLFGIDAPEKKQEFGKEAKEYLSSLVLGRKVKLIIENIDRYKRIVGTIYLKENNSSIGFEKDINKDLVKNGYAWAYREYSTKYLSEEEDAKMFKLGLWKNPQAINPADFRKRKKEK